MKRKILSVVLALLMVASILPVGLIGAFAADKVSASGVFGEKGDNLTWELYDSGVLRVFGNGNMENFKSGGAPWHDYRKQITEIQIEKGVNYIGEQAFYDCYNLTNVNISSSVTSIGSYAFENCVSLASITIPESVTDMGYRVFASCKKLKTIYGYSGSEAETYANEYGINFEAIDSDTTYYTVTFYDYYGNVWDTQTVAEGNSANYPKEPYGKGYEFKGWDTDFSCVTSDLYINPYYSKNTYTVYFYDYWSNLISSQEVEYGGMAEAPKDFEGPSDGTFIGWDSSFDYVTSDLYIYAVYKITVASGTFGENGDNLTWQLDNYNLLTISGEGGMGDFAWDGAPWSDYRYQISNVQIEYGVTSIGDHAFYDCNSFTSITIPSSVTYMGNNAFYNCNNLTSITIPYGVTSLGYGIFNCCANLTSITIPDSVTSIGNSAIHACSRLSMAIIPESVTEIGEDVFENCGNLTIYGYSGSTAEEYANENGIPFNAIDPKATYYTVSFYDYWGIISVQLVEDGEAATEPSSDIIGEPSGCYFTGWNQSFDYVTSNLDIYAQYEAMTYTVTFYDDYKGNVWNTQTVYFGNSAYDPGAPYKEGYRFIGWDTDLYNVTSDLYIYPQYEEITTCTVTFYDDYKGNVWNTQIVEYGGSAYDPGAPYKEGYRFIGWDNYSYKYVTSDLYIYPQFEEITTFTVRFYDYDHKEYSVQTVDYGNSAYDPGEPYKEGYIFTGWDTDFSYVTSNLYIYPNFEEIEIHNVYFYDYNGVYFVKVTVEHGQSVTAPITPSRTGYEFIGWDQSLDNVTSDMYVYAQYKALTYTVTFIDWDGTVLKTQKVDYNKNATAPANPVREGYTFNKWNKSYKNVKSDITVLALYKVKTYTVVFKDEDGTVLSTQTVEHGRAAEAPEAPAKEGYNFIGWDKAFNNILEDKEITAVYEVKKYTVNFYDYNGNLISSQEVEYRQSAVAPVTSDVIQEYDEGTPVIPDHEGYDFKGWSGDYTNVTENVNAFAQYEVSAVKTFEVNFDEAGNQTIISSDNMVTAPEPKQGVFGIVWTKCCHRFMKFVGWVDENGNTIDPNSKVSANDAHNYKAGYLTIFEYIVSKITGKKITPRTDCIH